MDETPISREHADDPVRPAYRAGIADGNLANSMELGDFLHGLGVVLRLPPKRSKATPRHTIVEQQVASRRTGRSAYAALVVVGVGVFAWYWRPAPEIPQALRGTWVTDDPKYSSRALGFDAGVVQIRTGEQASDVVTYPVRRVVRRATSSGSVITVVYESDGAPVELNLILSNHPTPSLHLRHQASITWHRRT